MAARGAKVLEPIWVREAGRKGRLSIQTNPTFFRDPQRMLEQGRYFHTLAPNMQVKFPATSAGLRALEVGEAVERALRRREAEGLDVAHMSPVCTLMIGRLDDWMKAICERDDIIVDPAAPNWAGIAVLKKAYRIFHERGYRARLLAAAYRHHLHWSELIGGDIVMTMPFQW